MLYRNLIKLANKNKLNYNINYKLKYDKLSYDKLSYDKLKYDKLRYDKLSYDKLNINNLNKGNISIELINEPIIKSLNLELLDSKRTCFPNDCPCSKAISKLSVSDFESKNSKYYYWLPILRSRHETWCPLDPDPIAIALNFNKKKKYKNLNNDNITKVTRELEKMVS